MAATTLQSSRNAQFAPTFFADQYNHLYVVDGINQGRRWNGVDSSTNQIGIAAPTVAASVLTPVGGNASAGDYTIYYRYKRVEGGVTTYSSLSPVTTATAAANDKFEYTITSSGDTSVTHVELVRSKVNASTVVYLVTTLTAGTTTYTLDTLSDTALGANTAYLVDNEDGSENLNRFDPPPLKRFATAFFNRVYYYGDLTYDIGSAEVTNGSPSVQFRGTNMTSQVVGWKVYFDAQTTEYELSAFNTATQVGTLTANYGGATNLFAAYSAKPAKTGRSRVYWTSADEPEGVRDLDYLITSVGGEEFTGGFDIRANLYVAEPKRIWQLFVAASAGRASANNRPGTGIMHAVSRGLLNNRCWAKVEDRAFCMDEDGCYIFDGAQEEAISPPIYDLWRDGRINLAARDWFFVSVDPRQEVVRFHVCLGYSYLPRHALVWHYRQNQWQGIEEYPWRFGHACLADVDGKPTAVLGGEFGSFYLQEGTLDGLTARTIRGTATSATWLTLADTSSDAVVPASSVGATLQVVAGRGKGQQRRIVAVSSGTMTIDREWITLPDTTSEYQIGGVSWYWKSPVFQYPDTPQDSRYTREFAIEIEPTINDASSVDVRRYYDHATAPETFVQNQDLGAGVFVEKDSADIVMRTKRSQTTAGVFSNRVATFTGRRHFRLDGYLGDRSDDGRFIQVELRGVQGMDRIRVYGLQLKGKTQKG